MPARGRSSSAVRAMEQAPQSPAERVCIDDDDEDLAQAILRAQKFLYAMPGVALALEQERAVAHGIRRPGPVEIVEIRRAGPGETPAVVEDDGFPAPVSAPLLGRIEIEDMRADLALGIAVRRNRGAARCEMPVVGESEAAGVEQSRQPALVDRAVEFRDQLVPGRMDVQVSVVFQRIAIVRCLAMGALAPE